MPRFVGLGKHVDLCPRVRRTARGDTLIEVLLAVVIIGVVFSAFFVAMSTGSSASAAHRNYVTADALLRDYAEAAKAGARADCATSTTLSSRSRAGG